MLKKFILVLLLVPGTAITAFAQQAPYCREHDPRAHPRDHNIDIEHMLLEVSFEPEKGLVKGNVIHTFRTLQKQVDSIVLDAVNIRFEEVKIDANEVQYRNTGTALIIYPNRSNSPGAQPDNNLKWESKHALQIKYEANPARGIWFIGWSDSTGRSRKQIWTQGQGIDNRHWIPSFDDPSDKLVTEIKVTMPEPYKVLSNGQKINDVTQKNGMHFWHYRISHPHALYLTMLGIGDYKVKSSRSKSGVPIYAWYYPDQENRVEPTYRYTERIMDFFEKETGYAYPWESYSQIPVQDFLYGAMENTTATVFGDFFCVDERAFLDRNYVGVNAHEMAHQWFGDLVTARSPDGTWLQESFATFYSKLAEQDIYGEDHYQWIRRNEQNTALNAAKENNLPVAHSSPGTARHYQKGSAVLDMLREYVGHDEFRKVIQYYLKRNAYGNVTTENFEEAFHEVLGRNMDWFFDEWIYRGGEPNYLVSYHDLNGSNGRFTQINIEQIQQQNQVIGLFKMPVTVDVYYKDGTKSSKTELVSEQNNMMNIPNLKSQEIAFVLFDPGNKILKQVTFKKAFDELVRQAWDAPNMIDRYDAVVAMRDYPVEIKREKLGDIYERNSFHAIRSEILSQFATDTSFSAGNVRTRMFSRAATQDKTPVKLAAINNIMGLNSSKDLIPYFEKLLTDSSYNVVQASLVKLSQVFPENKTRYLQLTDNVDGMSKSVRITWLQLAITDVNDKYFAELADYTTNAFEFRTRINSFGALQSLNMLNEKAINGLFDASQSNNGRLAGPAKEAIAYFGKQAKYKAMMQQTLAKRIWPEDQRKAIAKLLE
jgi:aminopeptidase N